MNTKASWGWLRIFVSLVGKTLSFLIPIVLTFISIATIIQLLKPYFWLVIGISLIILIIASFFMNKIIQIHNERETIYDNIIEVLKNDMVEQ